MTDSSALLSESMSCGQEWALNVTLQSVTAISSLMECSKQASMSLSGKPMADDFRGSGKYLASFLAHSAFKPGFKFQKSSFPEQAD